MAEWYAGAVQGLLSWFKSRSGLQSCCYIERQPRRKSRLPKLGKSGSRLSRLVTRAQVRQQASTLDRATNRWRETLGS